MSYDIMFEKAVKLHQDGRFDEAESLYRQILTAVPENADILNLLGLIAQEKRAYNQSVELLYKATKISPNNHFYHFNLGYSLFCLNKYSEAEKEFALVLSLSPDMKEAAYYLGLTAQEKKDYASAEKYYQKAVDLDPSYPEALVALALLKNDVEELKSLDENIADNYLIKYNISKIYFDSGDLVEALKYVEKAYSLNPFSDEICLLAGLIALKSGNINNAEKFFAKAVEINPLNKHAIINLANLKSEQNDFAEAEKLYKEALDIDSDDFDAHLNYAHLLSRQSRTTEALEEYRKAVIIDPKNPTLSINLGVLLAEQKEYEEAISLFFNALNEENNNLVSVHISETLTLLAQNDFDTAMKIAENWHKTMPENIFATHLLSSLKGEKIEDNQVYTENLFDTFADNYDEVLRKIDYSVARRVGAIIQNVEGTVVDLGCGSGLVGLALKADLPALIGVDISAKMLEKAEKTRRYTKLIKSDIIEFLKTKPKADVLVAADVLCYFGDLSEFFHLAQNYKLCFSVEALEKSQDYALLASGRYAHSKEYIERLLAEKSFKNIKCLEETIRYENGAPIKGYIFTAGI